MFVTKVFRRFQRRDGIDEWALCEAVARAERGIIAADLGAGLIKQRVARKGRGRSGGFRTIIAYRTAVRSVFMSGSAKSRQANLNATDQRDLTDYGDMLLSLDDDGIETIVAGDELMEIECP